ncbi:MAG: carboxypeptidase regulatory-like domain-containing protein [Planctomycetes bacterium]|nr:carboxypeptidase regulatory-like domain-containing protein [Planctomycetota bacterium]
MGQATGTIVNDDSMPSVSIGGGVSHAEGNGGTTNFDFAVSLSAASGQTVTVGWSTADGTATAGSDYTAASGTLTFAPGETAKTVTVQVTGDTTAEDDETFTVELSGATGAMLSTAQATGTIHNDDTLGLSIADVSRAEGTIGATAFDFAVTLSGTSSQTVTVDWATSNGTATTADGDYTAASGTLTFAPGETAKTVTAYVLGDTKHEGDETFTVVLSNPSNITLTDSQATGTILNDDSQPTVAIGGVSRAEGNSGTTNFNFPVTLSGPSDQTVTVGYQTADGTATTADNDYTAASGTLTFAPGETAKTVTVQVTGDVGAESAETFTVALLNPAGASFGVNQATGTIQNDDSQVTLKIADVGLSEGNSGTTAFDFAVTLSQASSQTVTVGWATADGTATTADGDYTAASGTLTFAPGETAKTVTVQVAGDTTSEGDETFAVNLSNPSNASVTDGQGTGTVLDDDRPEATVWGAFLAEGNSGTTNFDLAVTLSNPSTQTITLNYQTVDGSATAASGDYTAASGTVTFAPGQTLQTITVQVTGDTTAEDDETFHVELTQASGPSVSVAYQSSNILDDDGDPRISIASASADEGDSGSTGLAFGVTLSHASSQTVTVDWATSDDTATTADGDYTAASGTVTFAPGQTLQTITVQVTGDTTYEDDEYFGVELSNPSNATVLVGGADGGILNDDEAPGSIGDFVWYDDNADGVWQQEEESGLSGVTVELFQDSTLVDSTETDENGAYLFEGLGAGDYTVVFTAPQGTGFTTPAGGSVSVALGAHEQYLSADAGVVAQTVTVAKVDDGAEPGTDAVFRFTRTGAAPTLTNTALTVTFALGGTATDGTDFTVPSSTSVTFDAGETTVDLVVAVEDDEDEEGPETVTVTLADGTDYSAGSPGNASAVIADDDATGSISGTVWSDDNGNAEHDTGEAGAPGVTVELYGDAGLIGTTETDSGGAYTFGGLVAGDYSVFFVPDEGFALSTPTDGFTAVTLAVDEEHTGTDAGLVELDSGSIAGTVWLDDDKDAERDPGEDGVADVTVELIRDGAVIESTQTDGDGKYLFAGLGMGAYTVRVTAPEDYGFTTPTGDPDGETQVSLDEGESETGIDAGLSSGDPDIEIEVKTPVVAEDDGKAIVLVHLSHASSETVSVSYQTEDDTATAGSDYEATSGTLTFLPGETVQTIEVPINQDGVPEGFELFDITLANAVGAGLPQDKAEINIADKKPDDGTGTGLFGRYYNKIDLTEVKVARVDPQVNFDWKQEAPDPLVGADKFSVRWTGLIQPRYTGEYTFYLKTDDGARLWVSDLNNVLINDWKDHSAPADDKMPSGKVTLQAGQKYEIKMEYYENTVDASAQLYWKSDKQAKEIVPTSQLYPNTSVVGDYVWNDRNGDGVQNEGITGQLGGVKVHILDENDEDVVPATTSGTAEVSQYWFTVPAGKEYRLKFDKPSADFTFTKQNQGGDTTLDSDVDPATGLTAKFTAPTTGGADADMDAGLRGPVQIDLDINSNGTVFEQNDGVANYLPGYFGNNAVLTPTAEQKMQLLLTSLDANANYKVRITGTSKLPGIASNMNSVAANYPSSGTDNDFVLMDGATVVGDNTDVTVKASADGEATVPIRARDFGGRTTVEVRDAADKLVATLKIPLDKDGDTLPDLWEDRYAKPPAPYAKFAGFDSTKAKSDGKTNDAARDDDLNEGGKEGANVGDRLPAFDEYRGFFVSGTHTRTSPVIKQVFVYSADKDPFLAPAGVNADGLNRNKALGPDMKVGAVADDVDAEIMLITTGEFDANAARLGDVNYNSPAPYGGIKQKYIWVVTDTDNRWFPYGYTRVPVGGVTHGPNRLLGLGQAPYVGKKAAVVNIGMVRTDVAFIDKDGSKSEMGGVATPYILFAGIDGLEKLAKDARRDMAHRAESSTAVFSLFYFTAADNVRWQDRNGDGHWDRGDELWIDVDKDGKYTAGDKVIFDYDKNLAINDKGTLLDNTTEFRFVRQGVGTRNTPAPYADGDTIYTMYFNRGLYTATRDELLAHEVVGHPLNLQHDATALNIMFAAPPAPAPFSYTGNGVYLVDPGTGKATYVDPATKFLDKQQDSDLQLRE